MGVQVQSACRDLANSIADSLPTSQLKARADIRKMGDELGIGWLAEQAEMHFIDARTKKHLWAPMIPPGWSVTFCPVPGAPLHANRNQQVRQFLFRVDHDKGEFVNSDFDAMLMIDADNVPDSHDLYKLLEHMDNDEVDVVGGVYCAENPTHGPQPLIYEMSEGEDKGFKFASREVITKKGGEKGLIRLEKGGLPTGCLLIKRHVFEKIYNARRSWFKDKLRDGSFENYELREMLDAHKDDPSALIDVLNEEVERRYKRDHNLKGFGSWAIGEDIWFCKMCHDLDISLWIDTRVFWGHIKLRDNKDEFARAEKISSKLFRDGVQAVDPKITPKQIKNLFKSEMQRRAILVDPAGSPQ